jgi:hypothetical protein
VLWASGVFAQPAAEKAKPATCPVCAGPVDPAQRVVVTDFRAKTDTTVCGVWCAMKRMAEKHPASRAIAHSPVSGKEIRIIRTGVHWVVMPNTAVFLVLPEKAALPAQRWRAFHRQAEYMQFLLRYRDLLEHKPKLARLPEIVRTLTAPPAEDKPEA